VTDGHEPQTLTCRPERWYKYSTLRHPAVETSSCGWRCLAEKGTMFDALSAPTQVRGLTLEAIRLATGLAWVQVDLADPQIPTEKGVYVWVDGVPPHALRYHGSGSGKGGLRARLSNQLRWRTNQRTRRAMDPRALTQREAFNLASEVPAVQQGAEDRQLYYAVAETAPWSVERNRIEPPSSALEWEHFISAASLLAAGHRGIVGGSAWEDKVGTLGYFMTDIAWDRLVDVNGGNWQ
jgi:hypothetical protein